MSKIREARGGKQILSFRKKSYLSTSEFEEWYNDCDYEFYDINKASFEHVDDLIESNSSNLDDEDMTASYEACPDWVKDEITQISYITYDRMQAHTASKSSSNHNAVKQAFMAGYEAGMKGSDRPANKRRCAKRSKKASVRGEWNDEYEIYGEDTGFYNDCEMQISEESEYEIRCCIFDKDGNHLSAWNVNSDDPDKARESCEDRVDQLCN